MKTWIIAVGSTRQPKLNAVKEAARGITPLFGADVDLEIVGHEVDV